MSQPLSPSRVIAAKLTEQSIRRESNRAKGRRNQAAGEVGQNAMHWRLLALGVQMVEQVHTPWKVLWKNGRVVDAYPEQKVSGDWRGVLPGGRSVLVEVKNVPHLQFSEFKEHQVKALNEHLRLGGLSLIGWVWPGGDSVMVWPVPGFVPRTSLAIETAKALNITRIRQ